jgi:hypothetical protein
MLPPSQSTCFYIEYYDSNMCGAHRSENNLALLPLKLTIRWRIDKINCNFIPVPQPPPAAIVLIMFIEKQLLAG